MDLISLVIINYNNKSYLQRCMTSIFNQTYKNLEVIFIDNESKDGSYDFMKEEYPNKDILLIRNKINNGYAGAANQGIKLSKGKYVMILNPDIIMEEDFIEKMHEFIDSDESIGALSGKLLKYDFKNDKKLNYIDSAGIIRRSTRFIDRGQNEEDLGQYDKTEQVFGVCGAAPLYRRSSLNKIIESSGYFDEDFFAYKEDIDLSWRLNKCGFKNMYYPVAIAYHGRGFGNTHSGIKTKIKYRKGISENIRGLSFRNHYLLLLKNYDKSISNYIKIIIELCIQLIYIVLFERDTLKYTKEIFSLYKKKQFEE